ncbi:MAG TPA: hypothetical protein VK880_04655 [Anaerolineales bacterium]|nr:hypothetical protein [Anaerolineales bacterium]
MKVNEYDNLIQDPSGYVLNVYLPRVFGAWQPFPTGFDPAMRKKKSLS